MYKIGIVGASGIVGQEIIKVLSNICIHKIELFLFASKKSVGKIIQTKYGNISIEEFSLEKIKNLHILFLVVSNQFSSKYVPLIIKENLRPIIIDNSSAFRYNKEIPLVIPEINPHLILNQKIIANPNCCTAIASVVLWPIHQQYGLKKIIISTYQAASGAGKNGITELKNNSKCILENKDITNEVFIHQLSFNVIPHIDQFQENGYTKEEMKMNWELKKIFNSNNLLISCTCVRVPTIRSHAESITIQTDKEISANDVKVLLNNISGVTLVDNINENIYPMPINSSEKYDIQVGRIRQSLVFGKYGIDLFICGDQLLKGAALNAVQIANIILQHM